MIVYRQINNGFKPVEFDGFMATCKQCLQIQQDRERALDELLVFNERKVRPNAGSVRKKVVDKHARQEYERFSERRREYKEAIGGEKSIWMLGKAAQALENRTKNQRQKNYSPYSSLKAQVIKSLQKSNTVVISTIHTRVSPALCGQKEQLYLSMVIPWRTMTGTFLTRL